MGAAAVAAADASVATSRDDDTAGSGDDDHCEGEIGDAAVGVEGAICT